MRRWLNFSRRLNLGAEDGIALVLALAILVFASASTATAIYMTSSSQTTSNGGQAGQNATALAKAGLNDALAVLQGQLDTDGSIKTGGTDPRSSSLFATPTTVQYPSLHGSVTYSGTIDSNYVWTITSTGTVSEQDNTNSITRTLHQKLNVLGINDGASGGSWSRFYQDSTTSCLTIQDSEVFVTNIGTRGNLCLVSGGNVQKPSANQTVDVDVGGNITITGTATSTSATAPTTNMAGSGWTNANKAYANDGVYATDAIAGGGTTTSTNLDLTGLGFSIPSTAKINGIAVSVNRLSTNCCNAIQTITESGCTCTKGAFTISTSRGTTSSSTPISYNGTAASIQSALTTSSLYGSGGVACTGGPLPTAVQCTFQGSYANTSISTMSLGSKTTSFSPSSAGPVFTSNQTGTSSGSLQDATVQLLKAGSPPAGSNNKAVTSGTWGYSSESTPSYGSSTDLWNATWTPADVNSATFGVRLAVKNTATVTATTAEIDSVSVTVTYTPVPSGIGSATTSVDQVNVGGTCSVNGSTADTTCGTADDIYSTNTANLAAASNPALSMPSIDFNYWWANAEPGPKHFCTNSNPGLSTTFFDNDASHTSAPNASLTVNGEMAPTNSDYDCEVWSGGGTSGTLLGEIKWNHTTHRMDIYGTVFVDGNFRFDNDGQVVNYFGRGDLMSYKDDEIDAIVCAGGTGTTAATSCLKDQTSMETWDETHNMMVLMAHSPSPDFEEYDQGGTTCSGSKPACWNGHTAAGFQGILYSTGKCEIHQEFQDSGPVICDSIDLSSQSGDNPVTYPTFDTFPSIGNLTDGQTYAGTANASNFEIQAGQQS